MQVVAEAADAPEALRCYRRHHPDVVLTDLRLSTSDGVEVIGQIRTESPGFADHREEVTIGPSAFGAGASNVGAGCLGSSCAPIRPGTAEHGGADAASADVRVPDERRAVGVRLAPWTLIERRDGYGAGYLRDAERLVTRCSMGNEATSSPTASYASAPPARRPEVDVGPAVLRLGLIARVAGVAAELLPQMYRQLRIRPHFGEEVPTG
jgi:hypothetical protein